LIKSITSSIAKDTKEANLFFVESLELWRRKMKLSKMNLLGHSLGGYISTKYAAIYPERVSRLILLSPLGVEENKTDYRESWRKPDIDKNCCRRYLFSFGK